jgi:hypothetical protein
MAMISPLTPKNKNTPVKYKKIKKRIITPLIPKNKKV